jgi:hypothetical protein
MVYGFMVYRFVTVTGKFITGGGIKGAIELFT